MHQLYTNSDGVRTLCVRLLLLSLILGPRPGTTQSLSDVFNQRYLYEPECEAVGSRLRVMEDTTATSGEYVVPDGAVFSGTSPGDDPDNYVRLHFDPRAGGAGEVDYSPYFRVRQTDPSSVALWLRTNGGTWKLYTYATTYARIADGGWAWVPDGLEYDAENTLGLEGDTLRTLDVAFTRNDQQLDQVYLESIHFNWYAYRLLRPFEYDLPGTNCPDFDNVPPVAILEPGRESIVTPFTNIVLDASSSYDPDGTIHIYDFKGPYRQDDYDPHRLEQSSIVVYPEFQGVGKFTVTVYDFYGASDTDTSLWKIIHRDNGEDAGPYLRINAKCAEVGDKWTRKADPQNASGAIAVAPSESSVDQVPGDIPANKLRFLIPDVPEYINTANDPSYNLLGVFSLPETKGNCLWINTNGGGWRKWEVIEAASIMQGINLAPGDNVIELAYCSPDLEVRYLNFSPDIGLNHPYHIYDGLGNSGSVTDITCDEPTTSKFWLEAECAQLGSAWETGRSADASNTAYVYPRGSSTSAPPADTPANYVRFGLSNTEAGTYYLQARINAPTNLNDSYYVRVNGGDWFAWKSGIRQGAGFRWNMFPGGPIALGDGDNTIDFAYREPGTQLDKVYLSRMTTPVTGQGDDDANCPAPVIPYTGQWLEAECADYGSAWTSVSDAAASRGTYLVEWGKNALSAPPPTTADNIIGFELDLGVEFTTAPLFLYGRINAPSGDDDSFWVRLNGGPWYAWKTIRHDRPGFRWNRLPIALTGAQGQFNTLEFTYREDGTKLDRIYVSTVDHLPPDDESVADPACTVGVALEAECGLSGGGWTTVLDSGSANDQYVVFRGARQLNEPVGHHADQEIVYVAEVPTTGQYHLFLRMNAPDNGRNSVWVRIDDGKWIKMWEEIGGAQLHTNGFEWRKVNDDGAEVSFSLSSGTHTIYIANREPGTAIDQLYLTTLPLGPVFSSPDVTTIPAALNCPYAPGSLAQGSSQAFSGVASGDETGRMSLYPNPVIDELTLVLAGGYAGTVYVDVYDTAGRRLRTLEYVAQVGGFRAVLHVADLPAGLYRLRAIEDARQTVKSFVKL
ncbi:T9SS type A sorting domain-containing protein [Lewinella sp. JB7]|uniref:T9SS type A sorting domain-containing protein n=1 Tax=Lewinella sp. JB7 TaxID=2962887 RepID=UPI0020C9A18B|nr:T9SS type A sorting domain-containing protein [Lewinella sp. JB7]MCP9237852.1 T9SS type A sorting domain-containing protein [Lewinella sp. JB7]